MENLVPEGKSRLRGSHKSRKLNSETLLLRSEAQVPKGDTQSSVQESHGDFCSSKAIKSIPVVANYGSTTELKTSNDVLSDNDDSMCDFEPPKKKTNMDDSLTKFSIASTSKASKCLPRKECKAVVHKKRRKKDTTAGLDQPSIESSFFKPQTAVNTTLLCPLCFKSHKDAAAHNNHMKSCAAKNKISTRKLLCAVELQEKQINERKAMGLLAVPPIQQKKTMSRKVISVKDPQLQLALALSMSLHEVQVSEEFQDAHCLVGEPCFPINAETSEQQRNTLQNFGFMTNKPMTPTISGKTRKKRPPGPTVLQIRTQEERDRITTVRIAEVLMGDEAITQALLEGVERVIKSDKNIILKSHLLRSYHCLNDRLWDKTQMCVSGRNSYSCNILESASYEEKADFKINQTELEASGIASISIETLHQGIYNPLNIIARTEIPAIESKSISKISTIENPKAVMQKTDESSIMDLSRDWGNMVGAICMSDVLVIVKGGIEISAHKLVFLARCSNIIDDVIPNDPDKLWETRHRILWPETDSSSAYAFLEYIYCGVIERHMHIFDNVDTLASVRALARKYQVKKLFAYLSDKSNALKSHKAEISIQRLSKVEMNLELKLDNKSINQCNDHSEQEGSVSSVGTDINSLSTACNDLNPSNPLSEHPTTDSDSDYSKLQKSEKCREKTVASHNLGEGSTSSASVETSREKSMDSEQTSQRAPSNVATDFNNSIDIGNHTIKASTMRKENCNASHEIINVDLSVNSPETQRSSSPDIFDDSETETTTCVVTIPVQQQNDPDDGFNYIDTDSGLLSPSRKNLRAESPDLSENITLSNRKFMVDDKVAPASQNTHSKESGTSSVDFAFVSTRRKKKISKVVSPDLNNSNAKCEFDTTKNVSESFVKQKGDVTLAIEKMMRLNARRLSETDSESESFINFKQMKKRRNPFRKNRSDNSLIIERKSKESVHSEIDNEVPTRRRHKLSIFEKEIQKEAAKDPASFNFNAYKLVSSTSKSDSSELPDGKLNQQQTEIELEKIVESGEKPLIELDNTIDDVFDLTQDSSKDSKPESDTETINTTVNEQELSMFSRYKRNHSHNSIDKYRFSRKNISSPTTLSCNMGTSNILSSEDLQSSDDELLLKTSKTSNHNILSSTNEHRDSNQSKFLVHEESPRVSLNEKVQSNISPERSISTRKNERGQSSMKSDDIELSDLEVDVLHVSGSKSAYKLGNNASGKRQSEPKRFSNRIVSEDQMSDSLQNIDSFADVDLEDTDFTIMKNSCMKLDIRKSNISNRDTDDECCIQPKPKLYSKTNQSEDSNEMKKCSIVKNKVGDIYDDETDTGEMENKVDQSRYSHSKTTINTKLDNGFKKTRKSQAFTGEDYSSPRREISIVSPTSNFNLDVAVNISNEIEDLLDECKASSQTFNSPQMEVNAFNCKSNVITTCHEISDSEFADIERVSFSNTEHFDNRSSILQPARINKGGRTNNENIVKKSYVLDTDSCSDDGGATINLTKNGSTPISNKSRERFSRNRNRRSRCESTSPEKNSKSIRSLKVKSISENIIRTKSPNMIDQMNDSFDLEFARVQTPTFQLQNVTENNFQTPQQQAPPENVTPLANYSAMKTPELRKELHKYGLKVQKRHRAKQLLRYIYNELHPLVPVVDKNVPSSADESSSNDERPVHKKLHRSKSFEKQNTRRRNTDNIESESEILSSDSRPVSNSSNDNEELEIEDIYTLSQSDNSTSLETVFRQLMQLDRSLYNKILTYEPLKLEELHSTLKAQGLKLNLNTLMNFLDEQCITFRTLTNAKRSRTRRKVSPKKSQGTQ